MIQPSPPNYDVLANVLIDKTRNGKIRWRETALEDTYVAAVRGLQTYRIALNPDGDLAGRTDQPDLVHLVVKDEFGSEFLDYQECGRDTLLYELFEEAQQTASPIQERIGKSVDLLNTL